MLPLKSQKNLKLTALFVFVIALSYLFLILSAKFGIGGRAPHLSVLGTVQVVAQKAMEPGCTGIVTSPSSIWLVGTRDSGLDNPPAHWQKLDLSLLLKSSAPTDFTSSKVSYTYVSRLNANHEFELVAWLPYTGCLVAVPNSRRVLLLSDYKVKDTFVIFQSDDDGKSWSLRNDGFFGPEGVYPQVPSWYFFDDKSVWHWDFSGIPFDQNSNSWTAFYYSQDQGGHVVKIELPTSMLFTTEKLRQENRVPGAIWQEGVFGEGKLFAVQIDPNRAVAWVSQSFSYTQSPDDKYIKGHFSFTSQVNLTRLERTGSWKIDKIEGLTDFEIESVHAKPNERIVAIVRAGRVKKSELAILDDASLTWATMGAIPSPFDPLPSWSSVRQVWLSKDVIVVNAMYDHEVPRIIYPWSEASVSTDAVYYSRNSGKSWSKLSIPGYLGVLGLNSETDELYWSTGNWYEFKDLDIKKYLLK